MPWIFVKSVTVKSTQAVEPLLTVTSPAVMTTSLVDISVPIVIEPSSRKNSKASPISLENSMAKLGSVTKPISDRSPSFPMTSKHNSNSTTSSSKVTDGVLISVCQSILNSPAATFPVPTSVPSNAPSIIPVYVRIDGSKLIPV